MDGKAFRAKLVKIMPGYDWTVHRSFKGAQKITATGIQTSGFNRLSTLEISYSGDEKGEWWTARSAGYGRRAPWLHENGDVTLARALRGLQEHYRHMSGVYHSHERALAMGRENTQASSAALSREERGAR